MNDPRKVAEELSSRTGLPLACALKKQPDGIPALELTPHGHESSQTFRVLARREWRAIEVSFSPGAFAGPLVETMGAASPSSRALFVSVLEQCEAAQGDVLLEVNSSRRDFRDPTIWNESWRMLSLKIRRGQLDIPPHDEAAEFAAISEWTSLLLAAILALLPVETEKAELDEPGIQGWPEGAKVQVTVNKYERDRRNRAAALAIHGYRCAVCDQQMSDIYGDVAGSLIEIHHTTPVSTLTPGYILDPRVDLVPLCPNCHAVVHTRTPPIAVPELRSILQKPS